MDFMNRVPIYKNRFTHHAHSIHKNGTNLIVYIMDNTSPSYNHIWFFQLFD